MEKVNIAQIGLGSWGPNLLRSFYALSDCFISYCCDVNSSQWGKIGKDYPDVKFTNDYGVVLKDKSVQAVVIATPAPTHFELARKALEAGKHVYVEKPITLEVTEAEVLTETAKKIDRKLMVGHLLLYHPAVVRLKELIDAGELGEIYYIYTQRLNLGRIRNTENVLWSLAPHDVSVVLHLIQSQPVEVSAKGSSFIQRGIEDVVFFSIKFANGEMANIHVSWLDPTKTRRTIVVGSKKMAIFDEISARNTLTLVDKGVNIKPEFKTFEEFLSLRFGKEEAIQISQEEPLSRECKHFITCIQNGHRPLSDGENGLAVLKVLNGADRSLKNGGSNELL